MEWNEKDHPRNEDGEFVEKIKSYNDMSIEELKEEATEGEPNSEELVDLLGVEFKGYKGQDAVNKLLEEKQGHIKGAFHRDDIGDIDLLWGDDTFGLQHIIKRRQEQGIDLSNFLFNIAEVVEKGYFRKKNAMGRFEFFHNGKIAVISPELRNKEIVFLLTAYKTSSKK